MAQIIVCTHIVWSRLAESVDLLQYGNLRHRFLDTETKAILGLYVDMLLYTGQRKTFNRFTISDQTDYRI